MGDKINQCLYFSLNSLTRTISKIADKHFGKLNISASYAYLIMLINDQPGIGIVALAEYLGLKPSTITRLVDRMVNEGYLIRERQGKRKYISCTKKGMIFNKKIIKTWKDLHIQFIEQLSQPQFDSLYNELINANHILNNKTIDT